MIDIKELRVGNLLYAGIMTTPTSVLTIDYDRRDGFIVNRSIPLADLHGIPLSPEVLKACGFSYSKHDGISRLTDGDDNFNEDGDTHNWTLKVPKNDWVEDLSRFELVKFGDAPIVFAHQWLRVKVESLHQLQNLYFALTSKELNYKP